MISCFTRCLGWLPCCQGEPTSQLVIMVTDLKDLALLDGVVVFEPHHHVGENKNKEGVRASLVIGQYLKTKDQTVRIVPLHANNGILTYRNLDSALRNVKAMIFEGGACTIYDDESFCETLYPNALIDFTRRQLLSEDNIPRIFICISHQCCAVALVKIVQDMLDLRLKYCMKQNPRFQKLLFFLGELLMDAREVYVQKDNSEKQIGLWDKTFAVTQNEEPESQTVSLIPYKYPSDARLLKYRDAHIEVAKWNAALEGDHRVAMFHGDEVNEEAMLFVNYCFYELSMLLSKEKGLLDAIKAEEELEWLARVPIGVEIVASTKVSEEAYTEVACMQVYSKTENPSKMRVMYSTQFHPELFVTNNKVFEAPVSEEDLQKELNKKNSGFHLLDAMMDNPFATNSARLPLYIEEKNEVFE